MISNRAKTAIMLLTIAAASAPSMVFAAPSDIGSGVTATEGLLTEAGQWITGLLSVGAVPFIGRAAFKMHSAEDDQEYKSGKKLLTRSLIGLGVGLCGTAIVATIRKTYGM